MSDDLTAARAEGFREGLEAAAKTIEGWTITSEREAWLLSAAASAFRALAPKEDR